MKKALLFVSLFVFTLAGISQCENYTIQIFSYTANGGPSSVTWEIEDLEGNTVIPGGTVTFGMFTFQQTVEVCLEAGCFNLSLMGNMVMTQNNFVATVMTGETILYPTNDLDYGDMNLNYGFCTTIIEPTCIACFVPAVFEGNLTVNNCSSPVDLENTAFTWDFGDGTYGDGPMPTHQYEANGTYSVCLVMVVTLNGEITCLSNYCVDVLVEGMNNNECPVTIWSGQGDGCGVMNFEIGSFVEGEAVTWYPGDESGATEGGHFFSHLYAEPGVYLVCAFYTSPICNEGVELCIEIVVSPCEGSCPEMIVMQEIDCNSFLFGIANEEMGEVTWSFGDGTSESSGIAVDHTYSEDGTYIVYADFTSPSCPLGITLMYTLEVSCNNDCPTQIVPYYHCDLGTVNLYIDGLNEDADITWWWGETEINTTNPVLTLEVNNQNIFLCAWSDSLQTEGCPEICEEFLITCEEGCNLEIGIMQQTCEYVMLSASGVPNVNQVQWSQNGEWVNEGSMTTFLLQPGSNQLCAWFQGELCSSEWCESFVGCEGPDCPESIWSNAGDDCGVMHFEIASFVEGEAVTWYPGDESGAVEGGHFFTHVYTEPGVYIVCAYYTSPNCEGVELCTTIVVESCESTGDCPTEIWHSENQCGYFQFEIGSFQLEESVDWYFGDELVEDAGHFITHQFDISGTIQVCAFYTSLACPDGIWICTSVNSVLCGECTEVNFSLDSYTSEGGPEYLNWNLTNENGVVVYDGSTEFNMEDPWYDENLCLEDGCYVLHVCVSYEFEADAFFMDFGGEWTVVGIEPVTTFLCTGYDITLSLNSDCVVQECNDIVLGIDSYQSDGGAHYISWTILDMEGNVVETGEHEYTNQNPYLDLPLCLLDGCYTVVIHDMTTGEFSYETLQTFATWNGEPLPMIQELVIDGAFATLTFSLNGDCVPECSDNEVTVVISSSYIEAGVDNFSITLSYDDIPLEVQELITCMECPQEMTYTFCLADGCYGIEINSDLGINAESIIIQAFLNGLEIPDGLLELSTGMESGFLQIGLNADCENFIDDTDTSGLSLYPNPTSNKLNLTFEESIKGTLRVFDAMGRILIQNGVSGVGVQLDVSNLASGVYTLVLMDGNSVQSRLFEVVK